VAQRLEREQPANERPAVAEAKETGRIEAFSDGVFAIAITLLILEVGKPDPKVDAERLIHELIGLWPQFVAYTVSFVTILIMWVNHHALFRLIRRTDRLFMVLNGLLLMMITFINYPTAVFADQLQVNFQRLEGAQVALAFYSGTFVVIAVLYNRMWWYAAHRGHLLLPGVEQQVKQIDRQFVFGPLLYMVAFALGFVGPAPVAIVLGFGMDSALALYYALSGDINPLAPLAQRILERGGDSDEALLPNSSDRKQ
jgi:TMEM175 potassium channel family protein